MLDFTIKNCKILVLLLIILGGGYYIYNLFAHELIVSLRKKDKDRIIKYGLIHYTTAENARKILSSQKIYGSIDKGSIFKRKKEQILVWSLINSESLLFKLFRRRVIGRHCPRNKRKEIKYETKLLIQGIRGRDIIKMKMNLELSIGFYVKQIDELHIQIAPLDEVDIAMGIKKIKY